MHSWTSSFNPGLSGYLLEDGDLLRTANTGGPFFNAGGAGGLIEKYDWDGNLVASFPYSSALVRQHHDLEPQPPPP